jgi:hypothetical protein
VHTYIHIFIYLYIYIQIHIFTYVCTCLYLIYVGDVNYIWKEKGEDGLTLMHRAAETGNGIYVYRLYIDMCCAFLNEYYV